MILQHCLLEIRNRSHRAEIKVLARLRSFLETLEETVFLAFQLLGAALSLVQSPLPPSSKPATLVQGLSVLTAHHSDLLCSSCASKDPVLPLDVS